MSTIVLSTDVEADTSHLYEILTTADGMRAVWTTDADVDGNTARFGFAMAPMDLECTLAADDGASARYTIDSGFPFWNGSVFEWELGPAARAESGTNVLFRHRGFEDGYPEADVAFTAQTWASVLAAVKGYAETGTPQPALG